MRRLGCLPVLFLIVFSAHSAQASQPQKYFVSNTGKPLNTGLSDSQSWDLQTLKGRILNGGDTVAFKCGFVATTGLVANQSGVVYTWYGTGPRPLFKNPSGGTYADAISIQGNHIVIDGLQTDTTGWGGIHILHGSDYNVVRNCEVKHAGMSIPVHGQHNLVTRNYIHHPHMVVNTPTPTNDDYGADGITCFNSYNEVSWNRIDSCYAFSYDYGEDGGGLGISAGDYGENVDSCYFHHNTVIDCDGMTEVSSGAPGTHAYGFIEAYNVYINTHSGTEILDLHLDGVFKIDVRGLRFENNTAYVIRPTYQNNCVMEWGTTVTITSGTLSLTNNVIVYSNSRALFYWLSPGSPGLSHNVYWSLQGINNVGKAMDATDMFADPVFVNPAQQDLHLQGSSPAAHPGTTLGPPPSMFADPRVDADGNPYVGTPNAGAYEYRLTTSPSPTPPGVIDACVLNQNYPNPFNPSTQIEYELTVAGYASLKVYDSLGSEVLTLYSGFQTAGKHTLQWDARGLASGVYFCTLRSGGTASTRRMILLR